MGGRVVVDVEVIAGGPVVDTTLSLELKLRRQGLSKSTFENPQALVTYIFGNIKSVLRALNMRGP